MINQYRQWEQSLIHHPDIMGGETVFSGSRVTVKRIANLVNRGESLSVIREDYPFLTDEDIRFSTIFADKISQQKRTMFDESKYYLGRLCKSGHEYKDTGKSLRAKHRRACVECSREYNRKYHNANKDKIKERKSKYWAENKTRLLLGRLKRKAALDP